MNGESGQGYHLRYSHILFDRWYYWFDECHLNACTFNVHALLHIPAYIRQAGPTWTTWAFPMECFCGLLGSCITSRLHPYETLSHHMKRSAQLSQLKAHYTRVWDHVSNESIDGALAGTEVIYPECKSSPLLLFVI